ncbi:MAG TPA: ClbS/DfsB family four-helix bundle protein [Anaerolineaceae bacterium]
MAHATTKTELIEACQKEFAALEKLIAPLTPEQLCRAGALGEWSVKDALAHLYEWQQMFFGWYIAGLRGEKPALPAPGYNWGQLPALNQAIYEKYRAAALEWVLAAWRDSHQKTLELAQSLPESDLFAAGRYPWQGNHTLATFINANGARHYRWARTAIRKQIKGWIGVQ